MRYQGDIDMRGASPHNPLDPINTRLTVVSGCVVACLLLLAVGVVAPLAPDSATAAPAQQQSPRIQQGELVFTSVTDWGQGVVDGLLVSNNAGGELRLEDDEFEGGFISQPFATPFAFNAAGAFWHAEVVEGTDLELEVRGRSTLPTTTGDEGWGPWLPLEAGDARSAAESGAFATPDVVPFPDDTRYLQVRANFSTNVPRASVELRELTIAYLNSTEGPAASPGLPRTPINVGPSTLTEPPEFILRSTWSASQPIDDTERRAPQGIIVHQIGLTSDMTRTLPFLRALAAYQEDVLGWEDMAYHYIIDNQGVLYQGRPGGPTSWVPRMAGGGTAVHIAVMSDLDERPSELAQVTLENLLAWVGQAYDIPPDDQHEVLVEDVLTTRPNIAAHSEIVPEAPDPGEPLRDLMPALRERADRATVRARWYFTEGNSVDYSQQLAFFNPTDESTEAIIRLYPNGTTDAVRRRVSVPSEGRADFLVNNVVTDTTNLPVIVEASEAIIAEQTIGLLSDIDIGPGAAQSSRIWYFAEGATRTGFETILVLFNPQNTPTDVTITYMRDNGLQALQRARLPARQRLAINVGDVLPGVGFGTQLVASQPIVAERTMRFGTEDNGLHSTPGMTELSRTWYFAEGTTQEPFNMRLLLLNPNSEPAVASVTYMTPDGTEATRRYAVPATTRLDVSVNEFVPELGIATFVESDRPIAAERALYFTPVGTPPEEGEEPVTLDPDTPPLAGTVGFGAMEPAYSWYFADAPTVDINQFLLISNPSLGQASVTVDFLLTDGETSTETVVMPAGSRFTLAVHEIHPNQPRIAAMVRSTQPIVAERSLFPDAGIGAGGGSTSLGVPGD